MNSQQITIRHIASVATGFLLVPILIWPNAIFAQQERDAPKQQTSRTQKSTYEYQDVTKRWKELRAPYDIVATEDSEYFYVSSYQNGGIGIFKRDIETGKIKNLGILKGRKGMVHLDLNQDETRAVGCSYESGLYLFKRDPDDGSLAELYHLEDSEDIESSLAQPMSVVFSPDGRFVYVVEGKNGALCVFKITADDQIEFLQKHDGFDNSLQGARLMTSNSSCDLLFVVAGTKGTVTVFDRDPKAGHVRVLSLVSDKADGITKLAGAHGITVSPDDRFVYVVCGRFGDDHSVCVFEIKENNKLSLIQEWEAPSETPFIGGSHIGVSPDGKQLIATAWKSKNIAHFSRDCDTGKIEFESYLIFDDKVEVGKTTQPSFSPEGKFLNLGSYSGNVLTFKLQDAEPDK